VSSQPAPDGTAGTAPPAAGASSDRFAWHPTYRGRTVAEVRADLAQDLARDQRAYALALDGAEQHENDALATVLDLEKKWGTFDFGWAETDPADLAARVTAFEKARDDRRELIPYPAYRDSLTTATPVTRSTRPASTSRAGRPAAGRPPLYWLAVAAAVVLLVILLLT
jgi:hypothetical protein